LTEAAVGIMQHVLAGHEKLAIHREMTVRREEYLDAMTFQGPPRVFFREIFGPLIGLKEEWTAQGASSAELDLSAFRYRQALLWSCGAKTGWVGPDRSRLIEETDEHILFYDERGIRSRLIKASATLALPLEWPVRTPDDWERIKPAYRYSAGRVAGGLAAEIRARKAAGYVVTLSVPGAFDEIRVLLGDEEAAVIGYTQPDLAADILDTIGTTAVRVIEEATREEGIDALFVHEDMAGKSGPLWGPTQVDELMRPYYRRAWDAARAGGARLFHIDTDGDCNAILPNLIEAGINLFHPCEANAHMDIVSIRGRYGSRLALEGGLDKFALLADEATIAAECERKIPPMLRTGGCVLALDHRIPNGVPLRNYRYYVNKVWEILEREEG
jgi:hypothetical protein